MIDSLFLERKEQIDFQAIPGTVYKRLSLRQCRNHTKLDYDFGGLMS